VAAAGVALDAARRSRRLSDEADRSMASAAENAARERAWQEALLGRAQVEAAAAAEESALRAGELQALDEAAAGERPGTVDTAALQALEARAVMVRAERDRLARSAAESRAVREQALEERRRAEVGLGLAEARLEELDRDEMALSGREADLAAERERLAAAIAVAQARQRQASAAFEASVVSARAERDALLAAEAASGRAREQLRLAEQRSRAFEVAEMEARLQVDAAREGLLVELASIGPDGLTALLAQADRPAPETQPQADELPELLEAALDEALDRWRTAAAAAGPAGAPSHAMSSGPAAARDPAGPSGPSSELAFEPPSRVRIAALRRRFNEVGAGNPFAAQELAEVRGRLESLEAQRDDLERAIRDTREMMARLDELMTVQFRETFAALEGAFARRFHQLFGGGEAQLSLTDPADLTSTGVEITARPPGKRRQPLAMLSGGERALTAVALLMAMLEVRPVPFCVLDEVDAALDEANIGRFSTALRSLAEAIQFVVITHNRGTIEAADALYGVTVGDDAVSRVISLRLADVAAADPALRGARA
jgi:chromosome segregation protein